MGHAHRLSASNPPLARARGQKSAKWPFPVISVIFVVGGENRALLVGGVDADLVTDTLRYNHADRTRV